MKGQSSGQYRACKWKINIYLLISFYFKLIINITETYILAKAKNSYNYCHFLLYQGNFSRRIYWTSLLLLFGGGGDKKLFITKRFFVVKLLFLIK